MVDLKRDQAECLLRTPLDAVVDRSGIVHKTWLIAPITWQVLPAAWLHLPRWPDERAINRQESSTVSTAAKAPKSPG